MEKEMYPCLGNPMDRGAWQATSMGSQRAGRDWATLHTHVHTHISRYRIVGSVSNYPWHLIISETVKLSSKVDGIFHSYQQCKRVPIFPHPCQHLLLSDFFISVILVGMKWHLVLFDLISLMTNDVKHLSLFFSFLSSFFLVFFLLRYDWHCSSFHVLVG